MRVLITGGAGFIGSHLAEALLERGDAVVVLDDLSTGRLENVAGLTACPQFSYTIGSVTNERLVADLMDQSDVVFHLAAPPAPLVVSAPVHASETSVPGTDIVLGHAARIRKLVVVASTSDVCGNTVVLPFREQEQQSPVIVVRFFNPVGPRQSDRSGMVIPNFVRQALAGEPLIVHGNGRQTLSFTWVGDVVRALLALVAEPRSVGQVFDIGNAAEIGIGELAELIVALTGSRASIRYVPSHEGFGREESIRRVPDISRIQELIGYTPQVSLTGMLARLIAYWSARATVAPSALDRALWRDSPTLLVH